MKILYAIQGTGNGHISRARDIVPILQKYGQLDLLVSGTQAEVDFPYPIKYRFHGLGFSFGKNGGIDFIKTYRESNLKRLWQEIRQLNVNDYDLVISDFEPVSAWACINQGKFCVGLSHQEALNFQESPLPSQIDPIGQWVLKNYAPVSVSLGFHFKTYHRHVFTPVIRKQIRTLLSTPENHYTVYLPAYADQKIIRILSQIKSVNWEVFSKHSKTYFQSGNVLVQPINNEQFLSSLAGAKGVICGAGFETPAEVLYLKKKLLVIPMKGQYEQQCNAAALKEMGVPVLKNLKSKQVDKIQEWTRNENPVQVDYPDQTEEILRMIIEKYADKNFETKETLFKTYMPVLMEGRSRLGI